MEIMEKIGSNSYSIALFEKFTYLENDDILNYVSKNNQLVYVMRTR